MRVFLFGSFFRLVFFNGDSEGLEVDSVLFLNGLVGILFLCLFRVRFFLLLGVLDGGCEEYDLFLGKNDS